MTIIMRRAAVDLEPDVFWSLVEWARQSRQGRNAEDALSIALAEEFTAQEQWLAALLLDESIRTRYFLDGLGWEADFSYGQWVYRQPLDVLLALPGTLRLAHDYRLLMRSRSATIRIIHALDGVNEAVANQLRESYKNGARVGDAGTPWAPYF